LNAKYGYCQDKARQRWHKKALAVAGEMVVVAVHDIDDLAGFIALGRKVKCIAVCQVFEKSPEKHGTNKPDGNFAAAKAQFVAGIEGKVDNSRQVHTPDYQWMAFGKKLQHRIIKKLRLALVMDFLKLHCDGAFDWLQI
jgi:hypothetical protein